MARSPNQDLANLDLPTELDSERPKGDQIRGILEALAVRLGPGQPLPSERSLAERYGVARMTVRNEIRQLTLDGVLTLRPGSGAFVAERPLPPRAVGSSFSHEMSLRGLVPGAVVVEHSVIRVTRRMADKLEVDEGSRALRMVRVRTADGEPMGIERTTVSLDRFPGLENLDFTDRSLYETLRDEWLVEPVRVNAVATARLPNDDEAELLKIDRLLPCMAIESLQRDLHGQVIETGFSLYRGDRYDLDVSYVRSP